MKKIKKVALIILIIIIVILLSLFAYLQYTKPNCEGEATLKNISKPTTVYFDEYGVPHIYADTQKDAMTTLGYVHAQDRLWQLELMRRIAPGRLSEIFGTPTLKTDKFFSGIGIDENSSKAVAQLNKNSQTYILANAYLDGINQYMDVGTTPVEFSLLGIKKEKFTLKDVYNIFGFMSFSFAMAQKTDPLLTASTKSSHAGPVGAFIASLKKPLSPGTLKSLNGFSSKPTMVCPSYSNGSLPISVLYSAKSSVDIPTTLPLSSLV
jgi:penicillin amidase